MFRNQRFFNHSLLVETAKYNRRLSADGCVALLQWSLVCAVSTVDKTDVSVVAGVAYV